MSEKIESDEILIKLKDRNYDLNGFTSKELENLQKHYPKIVEAVSYMGEVSSKSQEKVYKTIDSVIAIFSDQLKDPNLSEEAKDKLNDRIEGLVDKAYSKDSESKRFMAGLVLLGIGGTAFAVKNPEIRKTALKLLTKGK